MNHSDDSFTGASGTKIYYQSWLPEGTPKAVLIIVHGLGEHSGRYMNVVNHLVPDGYAIYALDHYGHGKSEGVRMFVPRFEEFTGTLKIFSDMVQAKHPDQKIFILGHSMGSLITTDYLLTHQNEFDGAIISGTAIKVPDNITPATVTLGKLFSVLMPKFGLSALDANSVSRDPEVVDAYVNDPLVYTGKMTARFGAEGIKAMQRVTSRMAEISLPIYIFHGSADAMANPSGSQDLYDTVSSTDKTLKFYEGYYHETLNDFGKEVVLDDLKGWLEAHL